MFLSWAALERNLRNTKWRAHSLLSNSSVITTRTRPHLSYGRTQGQICDWLNITVACLARVLPPYLKVFYIWYLWFIIRQFHEFFAYFIMVSTSFLPTYLLPNFSGTLCYNHLSSTHSVLSVLCHTLLFVIRTVFSKWPPRRQPAINKNEGIYHEHHDEEEDSEDFSYFSVRNSS